MWRWPKLATPATLLCPTEAVISVSILENVNDIGMNRKQTKLRIHNEIDGAINRSSKVDDMSKLSPALKAAISASFARPGTVAAPKGIRSVYRSIEQEAASKDVGRPSWLAISVCTEHDNSFARANGFHM